MTEEVDYDRVAMLDLDGTLANYDKAMREQMRLIQTPSEGPYLHRYPEDEEPPYIEARRKMIQRQPGFWRNLEKLPLGFEIINDLRSIGFSMHVLTKGPKSTPLAWSEKVEWCAKHLDDVLVTITGDKSLVYARVLFDDYPPYFLAWLRVRKRGLVVCHVQPWNEEFARGGSCEHPNVIVYDGTNRGEVRERLLQAYNRAPGTA